MNFNNHKERSHALLSASGSKRWMSCPASALFSLEFPPSAPSKFADEGTKAHEVAEGILRSQVVPNDVSEEMLAHVKMYTDYVLERSKGGILEIEKHGDLLWIHPELKGGTVDANIKLPWELEVVDLKYGAGVNVDPVENSQLMIYALMALYSDFVKGIDHSYESVKLTIVQPRCGGIKTWETTTERLADFAMELKKCAENAMMENASFCSGEHCRWCPCAHACPELTKVTKEAVLAEFDFIPTTRKISEEQMALVVKNKAAIENFISACEEHLMSKMVVGGKVEGLKLVRGRGSRDWALPVEEIESKLLTMTNPSEIYLSGLKSVAQIEKIIGKKNMEPLTINKTGKIVLALETDKRARIETVSPEDFSNDHDLMD